MGRHGRDHWDHWQFWNWKIQFCKRISGVGAHFETGFKREISFGSQFAYLIWEIWCLRGDRQQGYFAERRMAAERRMTLKFYSVIQ